MSSSGVRRATGYSPDVGHSLLLLAAQEAEHVKPLDGRSIAITVGIIVVVMALVILAGFGYFSPGGDGGESH